MTSFGERVRGQLRQELLAAAAAIVVEGGWARLRMQAIADEVGVSRRTVYNEFGSKPKLAEALILQVTERFLDEVEQVFLAASDPATGWRDAVSSTLRAAETDPLLVTVLTGAESADFLPLLTSDSAAVVDHASARMAGTVLRRWPEIPPGPARLACESTVRLALSHIVRPGGSVGDAAHDIAELVVGYLAGVADPAAESGDDVRARVPQQSGHS
ncbi:TetR/AcrR family transcriptional regulator [Pseudonocardia phyllosphaerae]|uniref:TetR/AcrR family transcriptional regulator n=1 Tax=Pseudonocardia phyllosphaerae TaxID=3390502 RepID=UPI00397C466D